MFSFQVGDKVRCLKSQGEGIYKNHIYQITCIEGNWIGFVSEYNGKEDIRNGMLANWSIIILYYLNVMEERITYVGTH